MEMTIEPHELAGTIPAIASKSEAHRVLICAAFSDTVTDIDCETTSEDIEATLGCLENLGARVARTSKGFRVVPIRRGDDGMPKAIHGATLDCGESGSTLRFLLPVVAALGCDAQLTGHGRLASRPLSPLYEELTSHGATLSEQGAFPLRVTGELAADDQAPFMVPGNVSSQFVSGLLMAAAAVGSGIEVRVSEPVQSRPYIGLTTRALELFGVKAQCSREDVLGGTHAIWRLPRGMRLVSPKTARVAGDWSNASVWLAAGTLSSAGVEVTGLDLSSPQGDRAILGALALLGGRVTRRPCSAHVCHDDLVARTINVSDCPDLVPALAAVASVARGTTRITGASRLRIKESDRLVTISNALNNMGADVSASDDGLEIRGVSQLSGGVVDAANDHRIAMMAAVCAAFSSGPTTIVGAECVAKSYPSFFEDFRSLGGIAHSV